MMLNTSIWCAIGDPSRRWRRRMLSMLITGLPRAEHLGHDGEANIGRLVVKAGHVPRPFDVTVLDVVIAILNITTSELTVLLRRDIDIGGGGQLGGNLAQGVMVNGATADDNGIGTAIVMGAIGGDVTGRRALDAGRIAKWRRGQGRLLETGHVQVIIADNAQIARGV